jgi:hypothetical protein
LQLLTASWRKRHLKRERGRKKVVSGGNKNELIDSELLHVPEVTETKKNRKRNVRHQISLNEKGEKYN